MYEFANFLKVYLEEQEISCRSAAAMCKIERTSLSKYIKGTRKPRSKDIVIEIGKGLGMSEKNMFLICEAYEKDKKGEKNDTGYCAIENIYSGYKQNYRKDLHLNIQNKQADIMIQPIADLNSQEEILFYVEKIVSTASLIKIHVNMDSMGIFELIKKNCTTKNQCKIEQVVEINGKDNEMLFQCFEKLTPLLLMEPCYRVYYRFLWMKTTDMNVKMNYIITDVGVLMFDSEISYGLYLCAEQYYGYFKKKFDALCLGSRLFAENGMDRVLDENTTGNYQMISNPDSGMEFMYCHSTDTFLIGKKDKKQRFCIKEDRIMSELRKFMENQCLDIKAD